MHELPPPPPINANVSAMPADFEWQSDILAQTTGEIVCQYNPLKGAVVVKNDQDLNFDFGRMGLPVKAINDDLRRLAENGYGEFPLDSTNLNVTLGGDVRLTGEELCVRLESAYRANHVPGAGHTQHVEDYQMTKKDWGKIGEIIMGAFGSITLAKLFTLIRREFPIKISRSRDINTQIDDEIKNPKIGNIHTPSPGKRDNSPPKFYNSTGKELKPGEWTIINNFWHYLNFDGKKMIKSYPVPTEDEQIQADIELYSKRNRASASDRQRKENRDAAAEQPADYVTYHGNKPMITKEEDDRASGLLSFLFGGKQTRTVIDDSETVDDNTST